MTPELSSLIPELKPLVDDLASVMGIALVITAKDGRLLLVAGQTPGDVPGADDPIFNAHTGRIEWGALRTTPDAETQETPFHAAGEAIGTLWLLRPRSTSIDATAVASLLERELGAVHARQDEVDGMASELLTSYEEINRFYELAKVFDAANNENELCKILLCQVLAATGGEGGAVILLDGDTPFIATLAGAVELSLGERQLPPYAIVDHALRRGLASNVSGSTEGTADRPSRPTIVVPVPIKGNPVGAVIVQTQNRAFFHAGEMKIAQSMCSQAGVFLNNLRQAGRLIEAARISRDIEVAESFQRQLLPTGKFKIPNLQVAAAYLATNQIGGDYYDLLHVSPHEVCVIVADVSGHSIASGLLMTAARSVTRLLVEQGLTSNEILRRLNEVLYHDLDRSGHFISMFCLLLNVETWEGSYANAGHNPAFWRTDRGTMLKTLDATGPLLGIFDDTTFEQEHFAMTPGDALVLYTDGIPEARNEQGDMFGEERLQALVVRAGSGNAQRIVDDIMMEVRQHQPHRLTDDVTLVVLKPGALTGGPELEKAATSVSYRVSGALENIPQIRHWLEERLADWSVSQPVIDDLALAVTEVCTNVARHGYQNKASGDIELELTLEGGTVRVCILDTAAPYQPPTQLREPTGELAEGGFGLALIHNIVDRVHYKRRAPIGNRVVLVKSVSRY
jgi:serine phosphatase RsbU (regulator of sigma subunit)/anti-sigma regulatory factor (Ser/Thr protein kinase)